MTRRLRVRFDGKVLVPEEAVDLPTDRVLEVRVEDVSSPSPGLNGPIGPKKDESASTSTLADIAAWAETLPIIEDAPTDLAAQHDHYLYGTPKRP